jgi:hypothetical protein
VDGLSAVKLQLLPMLQELLAMLEEGEHEKPHRFFAEIAWKIDEARTEADLMQPFMRLAASAYIVQDAVLEPHVLALIDRILASAQQIAFTLSAETPPQ